MQFETFYYTKGKGWSVSAMPKWDSERTLVLAFCAPEFSQFQAPIKELAKAYPNSKFIGCSTAGEIYNPQIFDNSISVSVIKFEKTDIQIVQTQVKSMSDSYKAGELIAGKLKESNLRGIFVLSEGLQVNGSELVKGLNKAAELNEDIVITGGLAGDGKDFKNTWAIFNGEVKQNTVVAVGFYGNDIKIGHGSRGGWDIFGPERQITRSKNNVLYELDETPALKLYKEYLGERASGLPATGLLYPLAIRKNEKDPKQLVRTILAVNEDEQSLTFAGDVPVGYLAQLMRANFDRLISSASEAGDLAILNDDKQKETKPVLAIAISCVGRRLLLGERTEEETESVMEAMPKGSKQVGFYSYGELSPYTKGNCDLHNQTMTLTTLSEK